MFREALWSRSFSISQHGQTYVRQDSGIFCRCPQVREKGEELRPRHITDRTVHTAMRVHFIHGDVFDKDPSVLIHDLRRFLVGKVGALVRNTLMNFCHDLFGLYSFRRSFLLKSQFPLGLRQSFGGAFQELRVFDGRSIRKGGKGFRNLAKTT